MVNFADKVKNMAVQRIEEIDILKIDGMKENDLRLIIKEIVAELISINDRLKILEKK